MNDDDDANDREGYEGEANARSAEELSECGPDLRADSCSGMHDERYKNIHIALKGMCDSPIPSGNDDLEEIGSDGDVGRDTKQINEAGHANVACTATQEAAEKSTDKRHKQNRPKRDSFDAGDGKADVGRDVDAVNEASNMSSSRWVAFGGMFAVAAFAG